MRANTIIEEESNPRFSRRGVRKGTSPQYKLKGLKAFRHVPQEKHAAGTELL